MKTMAYLFIMLILIVAFNNCKKEDDSPATVRNIIFSSCNENELPDQYCVDISTKDRYIKVTNRRSRLNCTTEEIEIDLDVNDNFITLKIVDNGPFAWCGYPFYDISFEVGPLPYDNYNIKLIEAGTPVESDTLIIDYNHAAKSAYSNCNYNPE